MTDRYFYPTDGHVFTISQQRHNAFLDAQLRDRRRREREKDEYIALEIQRAKERQAREKCQDT